MAVLAQQRQQMIVMEAASHTMRTSSGIPEVAAMPDPAGAVSFPAPGPGHRPVHRVEHDVVVRLRPQHAVRLPDNIWTRESGWRWNAANASGAYGIPQALPGSKMATAGADWQTNPATQIKWGLGYIQSIYGTPAAHGLSGRRTAGTDNARARCRV